jgi:DNA topoisomerase VI subunit B
MKLNDLTLSEFDREAARSRKALEQMPDGKKEWKPHDKSMQFGYLCEMVATIPTWIAMMIGRDELDIAPKDGSQMNRETLNTRGGWSF